MASMEPTNKPSQGGVGEKWQKKPQKAQRAGVVVPSHLQELF